MAYRFAAHDVIRRAEDDIAVATLAAAGQGATLKADR